MKESDIVINIESCMDNTIEEARNLEVPDELADGGNSANGSSNAKNVGGVSPDSGEKNRKERRVTMSAKKAPKPPRPPRGLSLDAADQKLIKEISEVLMIKRARIERMKALKKMKAAKAPSASTSSSGNLIAMIFTILFCMVIIFQGCHPSGISRRKSSLIGIHTQPKVNAVREDSQDQPNSPISNVHMLSEVGSPKLMKLVPDSDSNALG